MKPISCLIALMLAVASRAETVESNTHVLRCRSNINDLHCVTYHGAFCDVNGKLSGLPAEVLNGKCPAYDCVCEYDLKKRQQENGGLGDLTKNATSENPGQGNNALTSIESAINSLATNSITVPGAVSSAYSSLTDGEASIQTKASSLLSVATSHINNLTSALPTLTKPTSTPTATPTKSDAARGLMVEAMLSAGSFVVMLGLMIAL
ncbi:hypothetical protein B0J14DRAFT_73100 [Halenospora varia]|nr:hypothetical protein B0J14DRAFT_73100 [Halenospora varia]